KLEGDSSFIGAEINCPKCRFHFKISPSHETKSVSLSAKARQIPSSVDVSERYTFCGQIAKGGMGKIVSAKDNQLERQVAVKQPLDASEGSSQIRQLIREAQITARLSHPGIVPIHELGRDASGSIYYTMKQVHGETLEKVLNKIREGDPGMLEKCPFQRLLVIFSRVCDTIGYANEMGIIHRDIKPENVMLAPFGEYLVIDWGIAKDLNASRGQGTEDIAAPFRQVLEDGDYGATLHGAIFGTPSYMSPEQARGEVELIDARTDVFALGALLFEILTLSSPYVGESPEAVVKLAAVREIQKISEIRRRRVDDLHRSRRTPVQVARNPWPHLKGMEIPESLLAVALKAMRLDPAERYQTSTELRQDIDAYLAGHTTRAENADFSKIVRLGIIRHKVITSVLACGILLAGIAASYTARINSQETRNATVAMTEAETYVTQARQEGEQRHQTRLEVAPNYVEMARLLANRGEAGDALEVARLATQYDPALPEAAALLKALEIHAHIKNRTGFAKGNTALVGDFPALQYLLENPQILSKDKRLPLSEQTITRLARAWSEVGLSRLSGELTAQQPTRFAASQSALEKAWQDAGAEWKLSLAPEISGLCFGDETLLDFPGYSKWAAAADRENPGQLLDLEITAGTPDLSILASLPIESIRIRAGASFSRAQLAPLARCRYLKVLVLESGSANDLSFLKDLPLFALGINYQAPALDLSVLESCPSLRVLLTGLENGIVSLAPISRCPQLQVFSGSA
ncbi:MAG: serine/threonine-protein kinase, partial [Verrucomicrobiales bacterium]